MSETTEPQPETTQPSGPNPGQKWVSRVLGLQPGQQLDQPLIGRRPKPDLEVRAKAAFDRARPILTEAGGTPPSTPDIVAAKKILTDKLTALVNDRNAARYQEVLDALPGVIAAARKVLALVEGGKMGARQLETQQAQYDEMKAICDEVVRTYFGSNDGSSSKRVREENLNPGEHFTTYLTALETVEQRRAALPKGAPIPPDTALSVKDDCDALIVAAQAYLTHFEQDLSDGDKRSETNQRKFQIVSEGLKRARHFALAMEQQLIGPPTKEQPWDRETELRAGGLRAAISFESGYKKGSDLKEGGQGGLSQAFWVESAPPGERAPTKNFLFKPMQGEVSVVDDDGPGAGSAKEALAFANAKLFAQQTGIDLGIPETHVTTIGSYALDLKGNDDGQPRIGSLQEFAPSDGALGSAPPGVRRQIAPEQCRKIAMHDIMALNFDRHSGNLLLKPPEGGRPPDLIPIDHGCTLPSRKDFDTVAPRIGGFSRTEGGSVSVQNATLTLPGAYEPFDPDTLAKLDLLDPEAMVQGMRDQLQALDTVNPGLGSQDKVPEERLQMSKRAMMFMKAAARDLSPAEIQIALGQHGGELFDADDDHFDAIVGRIIADMQPKKAAYAELFTGGMVRIEEICKILEDNGWTPSHGDLASWVMAHPQEALTLYKSDISPPRGQLVDGKVRATAKEVTDTLRNLDSDTVLLQWIPKLIERADDNVKHVDPNTAAGLDPLRQLIEWLLSKGDVAGAEAKARDLEREALYLGLAAAQAEGDELYTQRDTVFPDMGTDAEENEKFKVAQDPVRQEIYERLNRRKVVDNAYKALRSATTSQPDLAAARTQLDRLRGVLGAPQ
jgi:hypothetical protein